MKTNLVKRDYHHINLLKKVETLEREGLKLLYEDNNLPCIAIFCYLFNDNKNLRHFGQLLLTAEERLTFFQQTIVEKIYKNNIFFSYFPQKKLEDFYKLYYDYLNTNDDTKYNDSVEKNICIILEKLLTGCLQEDFLKTPYEDRCYLTESSVLLTEILPHYVIKGD